MALTRKLLKTLGLDEGMIEAVIAAHAETIDALKKERDELRAQAGDAMRIQGEFDEFRKQAEAERLYAGKAAAMRRALREAGVRREGFEELLMRGIDLDSVVLDGEAVADAEAVIGPLRERFGECFATEEVRGTTVFCPPGGAGNSAGYSREEIVAMKDPEVRRAAIAQWLEMGR